MTNATKPDALETLNSILDDPSASRSVKDFALRAQEIIQAERAETNALLETQYLAGYEAAKAELTELDAYALNLVEAVLDDDLFTDAPEKAEAVAWVKERARLWSRARRI